MNELYINGKKQKLPLSDHCSFGEMMGYLQQNCTGPQQLLSSIRINGIEINPRDEEHLTHTPVESLEKIEITLAHPKELAEETLQLLLQFTEKLSSLSRELGTGNPPDLASLEYRKLIDGIQTFTESLDAARDILQAGGLESLNQLEKELISTLQNLLRAQDENNLEQCAQILSQDLPMQLEHWTHIGIPTLIRCRDS